MHPVRYFRFAARYWPLALVLTCALVLSYFFIHTYISPLSRQYQLDFGPAKWIEPNQTAPVAYFRTKIFLTVKPEQAWLQVAATDSFQLTVNGHKIGLENSLKTRVASIYDIKSILVPGTNVIGVAVNRESFPGSAQILVYGSVKQPGHDAVPIVSNEQWKVTSNTGIVEGTEAWDSPLVQDELWPSARVVIFTGKPPAIDWVASNPLLLQLPPAGSWLLAPDAPREAIFSTSLSASRAGQETWIQVASSGDLDLLVNGKLVTSIPTAPLQAKQLPHLNPATVVPPKPSEQEPSSDVSTAAAKTVESLEFEAYDLSQWIRRGSNTIVAAVRSDQQPATFLAEGFTVRRDGTVQRFQTDSSWELIGFSPGAEPPKKQHVVEAGRNGTAPWGYLKEGFTKQPHLTDFDTVAKCCAVIFLTVVGMLAAWLLASWSAALLKEQSLRPVLIRDALFHVPVTLGLCLILLLSYDYRFPFDWPFQPVFCIGAIAALAAVRLLHFIALPVAPEQLKNHWLRLRQLRFAPAIPYLVLGLIMVIGFALRYHSLAFMSFDHDEMGVIQKSKGVFQRGFPYNEYPEGYIRPATTYELVGYLLAFSGGIFGYSEWAMRIPSCIWGTLTIGVMGLMGRRLFNWRTGLIAALVYACTTLNIRWAQNAFYPQQCQLFSMITCWCFYEAIRVRPFIHRYLTLASVFFCLAFLSWEGCGFILPGLCIALIAVRWGEWWWLKEFHLYRCLFFMGALVVAQFCWRTLAGTPYIMIGSGLTNVAGPSLFFLNYQYQSTFYLKNLLLAEHHLPFTLMILAGLPFCWSHRGFRYVVVLLGTLFLLYTNFLAALSPRYCYFYQPLVAFAGIAAAVMLYDRLVALARREGSSLIARVFAHGSGVALLLLLFFQSNELLLRTYYLSLGGDDPGLMNRMNTYRYDYRGAAAFVKTHFEHGDVVIPIVPHIFEYYSSMRGNFFLDTLLGKKVSYTSIYKEPVFIDKFRGYPVIRNLTELREATHRGARTWILYVPFGSFEKLSSPAVIEYLNKNAKIVFESYHAKVFLIQGATHQEQIAQGPQS